jgi:hypothetical protein
MGEGGSPGVLARLLVCRAACAGFEEAIENVLERKGSYSAFRNCCDLGRLPAGLAHQATLRLPFASL